MSPLFEFARGELRIDPTTWYLAKVVIATGLLRESGKYEHVAAAAEVVHDTLLRIHEGEGDFRREISPSGTIETLDEFVLRCLKKTVSSLRSQQRKIVRRKRFDDDVKQIHYREHEAQEPQQERNLIVEQAQRQINEIVHASKAGPRLRRQAGNTVKWAQLKLNNQEIAALEGSTVAAVDKNRTRLAALIEKTKATEVSK